MSKLLDMPNVSVPYFIESHFYDGGLRFQILGSSEERPKWAPDAQRVGFRDEFPLLDGDAVIEFYRILHLGEHITWIGIFYKSIDRVFGNRENHAGAGLWLRGCHVVNADFLLKALKLFAKKISDDGFSDDIMADAANFIDDFLDDYIVSSNAFPNQFEGWAFNTPELGETKVLVAQGSDEADAWDLVSRQIVRSSYLPGDLPSLSRALILATTRDTSARAFVRYEPEPVRRNVLAPILSTIPSIASSVQDENNKYARALNDSETKNRDLTSQLSAAQRQSDELTNELFVLKAQMDENETSSVLRKILNEVDMIKRQTRVMDTRFDSIDRNISSAVVGLQKQISGARPNNNDQQNSEKSHHRDLGLRPNDKLDLRHFALPGLVIVGSVFFVGAFVFIVLKLTN